MSSCPNLRQLGHLIPLRLGVTLEALTWDDIDLKRGIVHIHRALDRAESGATKTTKTGVTRRFVIEAALMPLLWAMYAETDGKGRLVRERSELARDFRTYLERVGVTRAELYADDETRKHITFHDLRATGLTWMAVRGDEPLKIMQRAGHTDFRTTQLYVREAEAVREGFGTVFPSLPESLLRRPQKQPRWLVNRLANRPANRPNVSQVSEIGRKRMGIEPT